MKFAYRLFCISISAIFLAWIAKMHFIIGGDFLFRMGTCGVVISFLSKIFAVAKIPEVKSAKLNGLFTINFICLCIVYLGMMMKVSHIMNSQIEKDFVLDFFGIPITVAMIILNFTKTKKILVATESVKLFFLKFVILPWTLFLLSFLLYAVYSVILTRI